ncbi:MAG: amidase [Pseudomonadota bacterium]|nr:amidase [Pseudomonadota bacterium]
MTKDEIDLCYLSATEAIAKFKSRELSPVELCEALIKRNESTGKKLNATTYTFFDRALKEARRAETAYKKRKGSRPKPLDGICVSIKDFHDVENEITTYGSKAFEFNKPEKSAPTVERLFKAGAIMLSRSTTPEFAHSGITKSPLWGITRNPWGLKCTPGGSSGGAAALIAAGLTTIADGTDGGGSCRIPASFSGCVGYKPPFGRNPLDTGHPLENLLHYGPITRSVSDSALMQNVMSGQHVSDMCSLREKLRIPLEPGSAKGLKIAFSMNLGFFEIAADVRKNTRTAVRTLKAAGAMVDEVDVGWNWGTLDTWMTRWEGAFGGLIGDILPRWHYEMTPWCAEIAKNGLRHSADRFYKTNAGRQEQWETLGPILEKYDALICPTLAVSSLPVEHDDTSNSLKINGKKIDSYVGWALTWCFNNMAWCPVMSVPSGFGNNGMPTGLQIVGRTFDDQTVFKIARSIEVGKPWANKRPKI